jgi:hypothetical protein
MLLFERCFRKRWLVSSAGMAYINLSGDGENERWLLVKNTNSGEKLLQVLTTQYVQFCRYGNSLQRVLK